MPRSDQEVISDLKKERNELGLLDPMDEEKEDEGEVDLDENETEEETEESEVGEDEESESDEEESEEEGEDDVESHKPSLKHASLPEKTKSQLNQYRYELKAERNKVAELQKLLQEKKEAETKNEKDEIEEKIKAYAEKNNVDEVSVREVLDIAELRLRKKGFVSRDEIKNELEAANEAREKITAIDDKAHDETEWAEYEPNIKEAYPNATAEQIKDARELMDALSHQEKYAFVKGKHEAFPLSYVYFENKKLFDDILHNPKKKSGEKSSVGMRYEDTETGEMKTLGKNPSLKEINAAEQQLLSAAAEADRERGTRVMREGEEVRV